MNEKLVAGLMTALVIAPICAVCILAPAVIGSMLGGVFGWSVGLSPVITTGLAIVGAILVYGYFNRRKRVASHIRRSSYDPGGSPKRMNFSQ